MLEKLKLRKKCKVNKSLPEKRDSDILTLEKGGDIKKVAKQLLKMKGILKVKIAKILSHSLENEIEDECIIVDWDTRVTYNNFDPMYWIFRSHTFPTVNSLGGVEEFEEEGEIKKSRKEMTKKELKAEMQAQEYIPTVQIIPRKEDIEAKVIWNAPEGRELTKPATFAMLFDKSEAGSRYAQAFKKIVEDGRFFSDIALATDPKGKSYINCTPLVKGSEIINALKENGYLEKKITGKRKKIKKKKVLQEVEEEDSEELS